MQETLCQDTLSDCGCISLSIRQRMQETLYQTADAEDTLSDCGCISLSIRQRMQESLYQTADQTADTLSDSGCRRQVSLSDSADAISLWDSGQRRCVSLFMRSDSGCRRHSIRLCLSIRQRMQETSDSGCRRHSIRQRMRESLNQTADSEVYLSDSR